MAVNVTIQSTSGSDIVNFTTAIVDNIASVAINAAATKITVTGANGDQLQFFGTGLSINTILGIVTGGIVTSVGLLDNGVQYAVSSGFSISAVSAANELINGTPESFFNLFGDITFGGKAGADIGYGFNGADTLLGFGGNDTLNAGGGNDLVEGGAGGDAMVGGAGTGDTLSYLTSNLGVTIDLFAGTASGGHATGDSFNGFENIIGSKFNDVLSGDDNVNNIAGGTGADIIAGGKGGDTLDGGGGPADTLSYALSDEAVTVNLALNTASGGHATGDIISNFERLRGSNKGDTLTGSNFANNINGSNGADTIDGGAGADVLFGGSGADRLIGGANLDTIDGQGGADTIVLSSAFINHDKIVNFEVGVDTLEVSASLFLGGLAAGVLDPSQFVNNTTGLAGDPNDRFILDTLTGNLWYDFNGSSGGANGARIIAVFTGIIPTTLTANDFDIVA